MTATQLCSSHVGVLLEKLTNTGLLLTRTILALSKSKLCLRVFVEKSYKAVLKIDSVYLRVMSSLHKLYCMQLIYSKTLKVSTHLGRAIYYVRYCHGSPQYC